MSICKLLHKLFPDCFQPIEQIEYRDTCMDSKEQRNTYCPPDRILYQKRYLRGNEPTAWCLFHRAPVVIEPPDPPIVYQPKIDDLHAGFLGFFLWFVNHAWTDLEGTVEKARETFREIRKRRFAVVDWFMWLADGKKEHAHLNLKTPFVYEKGYKIETMSFKYWGIYCRFIELHKEFDLHPCPHLFMYGYDKEPYRSNGLDFFNPKAYPSQRMVAHNAMDIILDVFGDDYKPWVKPLNEGRHGGNRDKFHVLGQWHRMIWDDVLSLYTDISHLIVDVSLSEGCQIYLNEPLLCGKPYEEGEIHGDPDHNRKYVTRSILAETHSVSTKEDLIGNEKLNFLKSKWRRYKFHGDGSSTGSIQLADTKFREGNAEETYEMGKYLWTKAKEKGKQAVYSLFPMESFRDDLGNWNLWFENYEKKNIFWNRLSALQGAWEDVYE